MKKSREEYFFKEFLNLLSEGFCKYLNGDWEESKCYLKKKL